MTSNKRTLIAAGLSLFPVGGVISYRLLGRTTTAWVTATIWAALWISLYFLTVFCTELVCVGYFATVVIAAGTLWVITTLHVLRTATNRIYGRDAITNAAGSTTFMMAFVGFVAIVAGLIWCFDSQSNVENLEENLKWRQSAVLERRVSEYTRDRNVAIAIALGGAIISSAAAIRVRNRRSPNWQSRPGRPKIRCDQCDGVGKLDPLNFCRACNGSGKVSSD
jgi:hypothetical protein